MKNALEKKKKQSTELFAKEKYYILITAIILIIPFLFRFNTVIPGDENYLIKRIATSIIENKGLYDGLSFGGRDATYPLGSIIFYIIFNKLNDVFLVLIPIIFG